MDGTVDNCPSCGSIFRKHIRNICNACSEEQDRELDRCMAYMWKYPHATVDELSAATQVPAITLYKYVKEGKLSGSYIQLTYPCECCGKPIRLNRLCGSCSLTFRQAAMELQRLQPSPMSNVYNIRK